MTSDTSLNSYDEVPYPSYPYSRTHPDHLETIGVLLGLAPCRRPYRVLELGCAAGGNLIPMACSRADCDFLGVDCSARQIEEGQHIVEQLGLKNIQLRAASILNIDESLDPFDFIICHGVYSWVPEEVQIKIMSLCQSLLSKRGIAYISYNTQPGWRQRGALRDMMQYHANRFSGNSPDERIRHARELLDFLVSATNTLDNSYAKMLREQHEQLRRQSDAYIYHEHLEEHNEPLWFLDFCHRLDAHGLRYLGDADFSSMANSISLREDLQEQLNQLAPQLVEQEQYCDFVRNRAFRQSLICHATLRPNYRVDGKRLRSLYAATRGQVRRDANDDGSTNEWGLELDNGLSLSTSDRTTQLALELLSRAWPDRMAITGLVDQVAIELCVPVQKLDELRTTVETALLTAFSSSNGNLVELSVASLDGNQSDEGNLRIDVSPLVRLQAASGYPVVNRRHELVVTMPIDRRLLPLLDGDRDVEALEHELFQQHSSGDLTINDEQDGLILDPQRIREVLEVVIPQRIEHYRQNSLLS